MERNASGDDFDNIDWDTEDELEISEIPPFGSSSPTPGSGATVCNGEEFDSQPEHIHLNRQAGKLISLFFPMLHGLGYGKMWTRESSSATESSSACSSNSKLIQHFVGMGFPDKLVVKAIEEIGEGRSEGKILDTVLTYLEIQNSSEEHGCIESDQSSSDYDESFLYDSDVESWSDDEVE